MKKTSEEKIAEVLAECEARCPNVGDFSRVQLLSIGKVERTLEIGFDPYYDGKIWAIFAHGGGNFAHGGGNILYFIHEDSDEAIIDFAYMLFGFAERDAVADEKARLLKRYRARIKRLRADDAETHRIQIEVKDDRIEAERAKNAALVAAAELVIKRNWERINGDGSDYSLFSQAVGNLGDALAANEKGGANENNLTNVSGFRSFNIGDVVYHRSVYEGNEPFKVVGITEDKLLLEGDFSGGTHAVLQRSWLPIEGSSKKKGGAND